MSHMGLPVVWFSKDADAFDGSELVHVVKDDICGFVLTWFVKRYPDSDSYF